MNVIRISNHCTDISTWRERYGSINPTIQLSNKEKRQYIGNYAELNDKYFRKHFFNIVVFDPTTDGVQNCGDVNDGSIFVKQIVYDATKMTNENLVDCENFVKKIASGRITENINYNRIMKKNRIRLTESQLHSVIKESVKRLLRESRTVVLYDSILDDNQADEIGSDYDCSPSEAAAMWFDNVYYDMEYSQQEMPTHSEFVKTIEGGDLYHDYGAGYYFLVKK